MRSFIITVTFSSCLFASFGYAEEDSTNCKAPIKDGVGLNASEQCFLDLMRSRCDGLDECLVRCLTSGKFRGVTEEGETWGIGGGCFHQCNYGGRSEWKAPEGTEECNLQHP